MHTQHATACPRTKFRYKVALKVAPEKAVQRYAKNGNASHLPICALGPSAAAAVNSQILIEAPAPRHYNSRDYAQGYKVRKRR